ncbi:Protein CBG24359 [Caenorhabditis briggsae]|uniref:Protein CBG24359 n=1 Tax=Caenorhabditis briggsae TaxID=6238 RepID=A8WKI8_CAEBR|nr:Protein CBG24359 [Caenorhabditis briggsae]CAP20983.1 Protein CBG24359 [Caenorhabditis briggsae]
MTSNSELCKKVIKFISNRIGAYSQPENLVKWCELAKKTINYDKSPLAFSSIITRTLDKIEDLKGYSLMEKVRLVFIFSRRVSAVFVKELEDKKCVVELNDNRKITYFRSPDGLVFTSEHIKQRKLFKGKRDYDKPAGNHDLNVQKPDAQAGIQGNNPAQNSIQNLKSEEGVDLINGSIAHDNNEAQNFGQNTRNRVKIEDFVEEIQQAPEVIILDEEAEMRPLVFEKISLRKLAEQIETLAFNINLEDSFQEKALRAVRLFKANDQLIPIQDFNQLFNIVLKNLKSGRLQNPTGTSIKLCRLFEHLARSLIRPLGEFLMADTLKFLEEEIEKLKGSEEKIPLKTVQGKLDGLMLVITNTWVNLDE